MSGYLSRFKALKSEILSQEQLTKPTKPPFVSFDSNHDSCVSENNIILPPKKTVEIVSKVGTIDDDIVPFPSDWLNRFNEQELERLALMTTDGKLSDEDAIRALEQAQNLRTKTSIERITPAAIVEPEPNVKSSWPPDVQSLMDWFMELEPPAEAFYLEPHMRVIDPEKFFATLRQEIKAGPSCPRGRMGTLQSDLRQLKKYFS